MSGIIGGTAMLIKWCTILGICVGGFTYKTKPSNESFNEFFVTYLKQLDKEEDDNNKTSFKNLIKKRSVSLRNDSVITFKDYVVMNEAIVTEKSGNVTRFFGFVNNWYPYDQLKDLVSKKM